MRENLYIRRKYFIGCLISIFLLTSVSIINPIISGSVVENNIKNNNMIDEKIDSNNIFDFFFEADEKKERITREDIYLKINDYINVRQLNSLTVDSFNKICDEFEKALGKEYFNIYLVIFAYLIDHTNNEQKNQFNCYRTFYQNKILFYNSITNIVRNHSKDKIVKFQEYFNPIIEQSSYGDFNRYWFEYSQGKRIWAGNFVDNDGNIMKKPWIVGDLFWKGDNFYEWFINACDFIYGLDQGSGKGKLLIINEMGWRVVAVLSIICFSSFIWGVSIDSALQMAFMACGLTGVSGLFLGTLLLFFDWNILKYLFYGVNAFLNMHEWGQVNFYVSVTGDSEIINSCSAQAINLDAIDRKGEELGENVTWSIEEFTYNLNKERVDSDTCFFTICYPDYVPDDGDRTTHKQWEQAVPPPGNWKIILYNNIGEIIDEEIVENTLPRSCYSINFEI